VCSGKMIRYEIVFLSLALCLLKEGLLDAFLQSGTVFLSYSFIRAAVDCCNIT